MPSSAKELRSEMFTVIGPGRCRGRGQNEARMTPKGAPNGARNGAVGSRLIPRRIGGFRVRPIGLLTELAVYSVTRDDGGLLAALKGEGLTQRRPGRMMEGYG